MSVARNRNSGRSGSAVSRSARQLLLVALGQRLDRGLRATGSRAGAASGRARCARRWLVKARSGSRHLPVPDVARDGPGLAWHECVSAVGELGGGDGPAGDRGDGAEVAAGEDAELVQPAQRAQVEEGGAEAAAGEAQADALATVPGKGRVAGGPGVIVGRGGMRAVDGPVHGPDVYAMWSGPCKRSQADPSLRRAEGTIPRQWIRKAPGSSSASTTAATRTTPPSSTPPRAFLVDRHGRDAEPRAGRPGDRGRGPRRTSFDAILAAHRHRRARSVRAVGLDTPGPASAEGVISSKGSTNFAHAGWRGFDFRGALEARLGLPVIYNNDGNAAALYAHHVLLRRRCRAPFVGVRDRGHGPRRRRHRGRDGSSRARRAWRASSATSTSPCRACWPRASRSRTATAASTATRRAWPRSPASRRTCCPTG